ncbi:MAG: DnaD domain protein [bacterium]|nr:DnaD domain protein [bacterium]
MTGLLGPHLRGILRALSDRDWKTLCALLVHTGDGEYVAVNLAGLADDLGVNPAEASARLEDLLQLTFDGRPVLRLVTAEPLVYRVDLAGPSACSPVDLGPVFQYAESVLARPLGNAEILAIRRWNEEYGFSPQVIVTLLEDCYRRGHKSLAYLEKVAANWFDRGVRSLADAEGLELTHRERAGRNRRIARYLGLDRKLTEAEQAMVDKWTDWGFTLDVILKACATTVNIDRPSFAYIDRVLENWRAAGVTAVAAAELQLAREQTGKRARRPRKAPRGANFDVHYEGKDESFYEQFVESAEKHRASRKQDPAPGSTAGGKGPKRGEAL